jgi:hypothetical protein
VTFARNLDEARERRAAEREANLRNLATPVRTATTATMTGGLTGGVAKESVKAKPGKRPPTTEEREWMDWLAQQPCVACWIDGVQSGPVQIHHILRGGQRVGHLFTLPLCAGHHQHDTSTGLVARHPFKSRFEKRYGLELELLHKLRGQFNREKQGEGVVE